MDVGVTPPCVIQAAADYSIPPRALLALKLALVPRRELERGVTGQPAAPAAFPVNVSWQQALAKSFGITAEAIKTDLCWSARAAAYVLRHEVNLANGDFWEGVGRFPSSTPSGQLATAPPLAALVHTASLRYGLDPRFVSAIIRVESGFTASARSPKGALGLMQVMPGTAARYGVSAPDELLSPAVNVEVGTRYLRDLWEMFHGDLALTLAAYNAGEGSVAKYGMRVPPYQETQRYVHDVMTVYGPAFTRRVYDASLSF
jgi:soluble lytic murein transglycosylase-like protein